MRVDRRLLGWGLFFILVGAIPLATRFGYLDPAIVGRWPSLWPLLLVGWGLGLLLRRTPIDWIGGAIAATVFGIMGGGLLASGFAGAPISTGCGGQSAGTAFATQSGSFEGSGRLNIELNCGSLTLQPVAGESWSISGTETEGRAPRVRVDSSTVTLSGQERGSIFGDFGRTDWTVAVPLAPAVGLGITINAGDGRGDLDGATLGAVNMTVNAGSARLDLGGAAALGNVNGTVNAGSGVLVLPPGGRSVNLSLNAGSLDVCTAAGTPARVSWSGALGSNDFDAAGLTKVDANTWESDGFNPLAPFLDLRVSANAGSFGLDVDGTCDA
jgi:LiaF transmembrane domain